MNANDGPSAEMRPFARPRNDLPLSAAGAERLLARQGADPGAPAEEHALAMLLARAAAPARKRELTGEVAAVAAFLLATGQSARLAEGPVLHHRHRHRRPRTPSRTRVRRGPVVAACAGAAIVVALSGAAATGALPAPIQRLAHVTFGAPAPVRPAPGLTAAPSAGYSAHPAVTASPSPDASPGQPAASARSHGNGKAAGKATSAKPTPHGAAKGHTAATPGHK